MIVGLGVVEERASKFMVSPVFTVALSDVRAAFGLPGPMPPHPAREWEIIRIPRSIVSLCLTSRHTTRNRRSLICVLDGSPPRMALVGFMDGAGSEDSWSLIFLGFRVLGFDLETTGFNPRQDRVVQFALVGSDSDGSKLSMQSLVNPGCRIPVESSNVHGIFDEDVIDAESFE